jgi:adenylate cyclase
MPSLAARDLARPDVQYVEWSLAEGRQLLLGRTVSGDQLATPWDNLIADCHASVHLRQSNLHVHSCAQGDARLPIYYDGRQVEEFMLVPGEGFVIGRTTFQFAPAGPGKPSSTRPSGDEAIVTSSDSLAGIRELLQVPLGQDLDVAAFQRQMVDALRRHLSRSDLAAILHVREGGIDTLAADGDLGVSEPLVRDVIRAQRAGEVGWAGNHRPGYPAVPGAAWAYCVPVNCDTGDYAIYLSGKRPPKGTAPAASGLREEQRAFIQIVADILQSAQAISDLRRCRDDMEGFFPKQIRNLLRRERPKEVFRLDEAQAAILFCDLRGSSRFAEERADHLRQAWDGIQEALGIMTVAITGQNGCIGDFQGDAAMAFWGWPRKSGSGDRLPEDVTHACQAADKLREQFFQKLRETDLKCGIGIAAGDVVAGMLGTKEQRKIGVFGPAVNLAARLESMTKQLGVSILVDEQVHDSLHAGATERATELAERLRFLAAIQPAGLDRALRVYELLPPPSDTTLPVKMLRLFEVGREAFESKNWPAARQDLTRVAAAGDGPARFLLQQMDILKTPPADWDGRVVLSAK